MKATIATMGQLFGGLQDYNTMINLIGPMRVWRGDSVTYLLTVTDDEDARVNLTGMTITMQVRATAGASGDPVISKSTTSGITLLDQDDADTKGQATIEILAADTDKEPGLYYLDAKVADGADVQHVIEPREFTIGAVVTP
jgi:hypothetical protein